MDPVTEACSPEENHSRRKHPRGLYALFLTEMWERFSYYGMRAILVLFMVDAVRGGLALDDKKATSIYGLYTAAVYLISLPGGWLGDRFSGAQKAVWYGGILIAIGHFTLAISHQQTFYLGLVIVAIGSGMLKPNMSAMVGELYPEGGSRRDAGFTIFYMGINLGAFLGPVACGWIARQLGWHYGFAAAGAGMVLGLAQFRLSKHLLGRAGLNAEKANPLSGFERFGIMAGGMAFVAALALGMSGLLHFNVVAIAQRSAFLIVGIAIIYFVYLFSSSNSERGEKERIGVILVLFIASALFWAGFEQAGSSFNLFAERFTDRYLAWPGYTVPAAWFQALSPVFIIVFAPLFAWFWVALARRNLNPSTPVKFSLGLLLLAAGFLVMFGATCVVAGGKKAGPSWLITTYLLHTFGELCLSPVGLSSVTKLAPKRLVGQMMGIWFLASSLGNLLAGLLAGEFRSEQVSAWPGLYLKIIILPITAGLLLLFFARAIKKRMAGIDC